MVQPKPVETATRSISKRSLGDFERWWRGLDGTPGEILWDADPADLKSDLAVFGPTFAPELPVVDLGCGDGRQTRFLAAHFPTVVGIDIAPASVARARRAENPANVSYRVLDARRGNAARRLHDELGDVNIYMRGVLHAQPPGDQPAVVNSIHALLGQAGTLFLKELSPAADAYFAALVERHGPPPSFARMMELIPPGVLSEADLADLFAPGRFRALSTGHGHVHTVNTTPTGEVIMVPALYALLQRAPAAPDGGRTAR